MAQSVALSFLMRIWVIFLLSVASLAAQQGGSPDPLQISSSAPPKAFLRQLYEFQLTAQGGVPPGRWEITGGVLPRGMTLSADGMITGAPLETGDFQVRVTVTDSGHPAHERSAELVLHV